MADKHSPLPWAHRTGIENELITDAHESIICRAPNNPENGKLWLLDAPLIVRSVNAMPELVKALEDTLCELTACANQLAARGLKGHKGDSVSRAQAAARAALAKVKP